MNNIKRRKNYNARIMDPSLNKTNEDENETRAAKRQRVFCAEEDEQSSHPPNIQLENLDSFISDGSDQTYLTEEARVGPLSEPTVGKSTESSRMYELMPTILSDEEYSKVKEERMVI
ncbi:hypothetical protein HPULCUR_009807 [Helicostylum pulchrum]|uniref:Uncharacterized protein n=1 Tax=Helicostylum pulchrum TaxID=562976 RepID=A0ABP9YCG8_9FUNG